MQQSSVKSGATHFAVLRFLLRVQRSNNAMSSAAISANQATTPSNRADTVNHTTAIVSAAKQLVIRGLTRAGWIVDTLISTFQ